MDTLVQWDFSTDILRHPTTGHWLRVSVNDLGGNDWQVQILDLDDDNSVIFDDVTTAYNSNHLRIADSSVMFLEFN